MTKYLTILCVLLCSTFCAAQEEVRHTIPSFTVNPSMMESSEYPGFLKKRGDFKAFKKKTGNGKGVRVGIVDTGVDKEHSRKGGDLEMYTGTNPTTYRVKEAKDFTNSRSGFWDRAGHGSHVAGHIGAAANGKGIEGLASDCELFIAKGLGDRGFGTDTEIANAIEWLVVEKKVHIINLSLGGGYSERIEQAVQKANKAGVIVFAALGNDGTNGDGHPGNSKATLGIAAVDYDLKIASFSSRSPMAIMSGYGVNVFSCYLDGRWSALSGTSMATPDQVGCCALILSYAMKNGVEIKTALGYFSLVKSSMRHLGQGDWNKEYGYGFMEIESVLKYIDDNVQGEQPNPVPVDPPVNPPTNPGDFEGYSEVGRAVWDGEQYILLKQDRTNNRDVIKPRPKPAKPTPKPIRQPWEEEPKRDAWGKNPRNGNVETQPPYRLHPDPTYRLIETIPNIIQRNPS